MPSIIFATSVLWVKYVLKVAGLSFGNTWITQRNAQIVAVTESERKTRGPPLP